MTRPMISRREAMRKYSLPMKVYRRGAGRSFATPQYGYADERELVAYIHRWLAKVGKRIANGAALTEDEKDYGKVKAAMELHAPGGELLTPERAVAAAAGDVAADRDALAAMSGSAVDAQGLTDQDKLERMEKAEFGGAETKAEALLKINKALMDSTLAQEKAERLLVATGRLADTTRTQHVVAGYFRHVARGLETLEAQFTDRLAKETELSKEVIRKVIAATLPVLQELHKDGLELLAERLEELRQAAEAEALKRVR